MMTRRQFLVGSGAAVVGAALVSKAQASSLPEAPQVPLPKMQLARFQ